MGWLNRLLGKGQTASESAGLRIAPINEPKDRAIHEKAERLIIAGKWKEAIELGQPATDVCIERLYHEHNFVQYDAAKALKEIADPVTIKPLIEKLERMGSRDSAVQTMIIGALVKIGEPSVKPLMEVLRSNKDAWWATDALVRIGHPEINEYLLEMVSPEKSEQLCTSDLVKVIKALGSLKESRATDRLIDFLKPQKDSELKKSSSEALVRIGEPAIVPLLDALAHRGVDEYFAIKVLAKIGDKRSLPLLIKSAFLSNSSDIRQEARYGIWYERDIIREAIPQFINRLKELDARVGGHGYSDADANDRRAIVEGLKWLAEQDKVLDWEDWWEKSKATF